ncbi:TetR/AcrR family transcriptional regulator [Streptomyces yaizuensis]|uniref:TetR/AcrR family transcriptional regulator n=1 Tax=Streptomyces yaizuensis TaxID=2989713 RepID=A0ABQ5P2U5_9ACTN|nr:TetR/AcrR family transcriptional regulator [Streptomyces sp. YSPA8]GLF96864.1 TetR/AcrR family transcriptional regulator [Streptomyces sp. YSPA8]
MPRTANPERRREVLDAVIAQLAETGIGSFTFRGLADALGQSTRVLTHHFADKGALLTAVLRRLDERQHEALRSTEGWEDPSVSVSSLVRSAWRRNLGPGERAMTRLIREIEGLAAAGRLPVPEPAFVRGRAEFVASCLVRRGLSERDALLKATLLNAAFSGLQGDYLATGDAERAEGALDDLCAWIDGAVAEASGVR